MARGASLALVVAELPAQAFGHADGTGPRRGRDGTLSEQEQASYARVASVLEDTFRASSSVECMNSVLRMQQSRHRQMTQPMLNLKRLYWNTRPFRSGPRKQVCPYQRLGLKLPTYDFWALLQSDPNEVTQKTVNSWKCGMRQCRHTPCAVTLPTNRRNLQVDAHPSLPHFHFSLQQ